MEKYKKEAKDLGRETWYLSWALDLTKEERSKGKTVEVGRGYFETEKRRYSILDAPGHKTYVPSMIGGASQADIGIHMSSEASSAGAAAAASAASDAVLIRPSLEGVKSLIELSDAVFRRIVTNFIWAFVYNLVAILFAAGAFVNARIAPAYAGLGELVSVLPVVLVAMQLRWFKGESAM